MYKIFVGNKPIILTTKVETETNFKNFLIDSVDINKVLSKLKKDKYDAVHLIGSDKELLLKKFLSLLPNVLRWLIEHIKERPRVMVMLFVYIFPNTLKWPCRCFAMQVLFCFDCFIRFIRVFFYYLLVGTPRFVDGKKSDTNKRS